MGGDPLLWSLVVSCGSAEILSLQKRSTAARLIVGRCLTKQEKPAQLADSGCSKS